MKIEIDKEMLRALFDLVVGGMEFGSDFFDSEQTELLRGFAILLGIDPIVATPESHKCKYLKEHVPNTILWISYPVGTFCTRCKQAMTKPDGFKICSVCSGSKTVMKNTRIENGIQRCDGWDVCPDCSGKGYLIEKTG